MFVGFFEAGYDILIRGGGGMFPKVVQVMPMRDYSVYVYFEDGKIVQALDFLTANLFDVQYKIIASCRGADPENGIGWGSCRLFF